MSWTEITWDEVTYTAQTKIRCMGCSRRLSRQRTFRAPLRGGVTRTEIRMELKVLAAQWHPRGVCPACMASGLYLRLEDGNYALKFPGSGEQVA